MKSRSYRIKALFHNGLDFELYGLLKDSQARKISGKLDRLYERNVIKSFSMEQGSNVHPSQGMIIELNEQGLDGEIDRQILMLKDLPPL